MQYDFLTHRETEYRGLTAVLTDNQQGVPKDLEALWVVRLGLAFGGVMLMPNSHSRSSKMWFCLISVNSQQPHSQFLPFPSSNYHVQRL